MPRWSKLLIGLAAALLVGWLHHGPYGGGERFVDALDAQAQARLRFSEIPEVTVRMQRAPLARVAILAGEANDFQKEGFERPPFPGINDRIRTIPGVAAISWDDGGGALPLLAETLLLCAAAYSIGLGLGRILFGRRRRRSYLD